MIKKDSKFDDDKNYGFTEDFESVVRFIYKNKRINSYFSDKTKKLITVSEFHYDEVIYQLDIFKEYLEEIKSKGKFIWQSGSITKDGVSTPIYNDFEITYEEYLDLIPSDVWLKINLDIKEELLLSIVDDLHNLGKINIFDFVEEVKKAIELIGDDFEK